ncbi:MAG: hypothetical protein HDR17_14380 [Lachnospiraceae bacterium]|nr:hypothetical protein [Lachnospiraceae bacterium]MBD5505861.1 hypothetical protein [Lachnospiraceae bacterium]
MSATEIILIVIGVAIFLLGYLMPARKKDIDEEVQLISEDEVRKLVTAEVEHVKDRIADIVDETINYSIEKAERAMERVTNEKIMAVNEYSDTVLEEINKNHKEVVFLYDMLNDKHDNLMSSINAATIASDGIKQTARDAELTASEAADKIDAVLQSVDEAADTIQSAQETAIEARKVAQEALRIIIDISKKQPVDEPETTAEIVVQQEEPALADSSDMDWETWSDGNNEISELIGGTEQFGEPEEILEPEEEAEEIITEEKAEESVDFTPIAPRRVEIIHQPDGDYVAGEEEDLSTSAAFASMGFFAPKTEEYEELGKKNRLRRYSRKDRLQENAAAMDIQFAQGKDNGRNSNERILELHKAGKSNMAIAKELGLGLGEVKLVIDLFEGM